MLMGIFNAKQHITRPQLRDILRKTPSQSFNRQEKGELEKKVFGKKYGSFINRSEFNRKIRELGEKRYKAKTYAEKSKINKKIRFLKKIEQ